MTSSRASHSADNPFGLDRGLAPFIDDEDADISRAIAAKNAEMLHHNAIVAGGILRGIWGTDRDAVLQQTAHWASTPRSPRWRRSSANNWAITSTTCSIPEPRAKRVEFAPV